MARIPQAELDRIKRDIDLASLVRSRGIDLKPQGKDLIGLCPFHNDTKPSLIITPSKNLWHCMGACQAGGSAIDWVIKSEGVSFRHAVEILRALDGNRPTPAPGTSPGTSLKRVPSPVERTADQQELLKQVMDYYHDTLKQSPEALAYLEKRGLKNHKLIEHFKLGYANRTLGYRITKRTGSKLRESLKEVGILRQSTGHEHFTGCLVIPILDEDGNVKGMYGRKIRDDFKQKTPSHLYLPGPHKGVWNIHALSLSKEIILCEALIDALTFFCAGYHNVTSSYGIEGFTQKHLEAFKRYGIQRVLIAYDRDEAGDRAAISLAERLISQGIESKRIQFPKGLDANEYALKVKPAAKALGILMDNAVVLGRERVAKEEEPKDTDGLAQVPTAPNLSQPESHPPLATKAAKEEIKAPSPLNIPTRIKGEDIEITQGDRHYRIRGLSKNLSYDTMRVNIRVSTDDLYHIDTLDLYNARHRTTFINTAAKETGIKQEVIKRDIGRVLLKLEEIQEDRINKAIEPEKKEVFITREDREEAIEYLKSPDLLDRIIHDFEQCGLVGEETNILAGYLSSISRKLDDPLAVIIQASSSAGKSSLMDAILAFTPEEEFMRYTAMTGQSLFYMGETDLVHKTLAISEEEGAERARYAIKTMQSEKRLCIASTGKDPKSGRLVTQEYHVEGPTQIMLTTTAVEIDEELQNRCIMLTVNEEREQTKVIHKLQREMETLEGMLKKKERERIINLHQNAQRLLQPVLVVNPYARHLTFLDSKLRTRRDHIKYLTIIRAIALLHQYQRERKKTEHNGQLLEFIEVTIQDIEVANRLANEVLGRSLDELSPQTRRLLDLITAMVEEHCKTYEMEQSDYRFSRKEVREYTGWTDFQVKVHMKRLEELEYVLVHRGGRGQSFVYELLYKGEGTDGQRFLMGLLDVQKVREKCWYDTKKEHQTDGLEHSKEKLEVSSSIQVAPKVPPSSITQMDGKATVDKVSSDSPPKVTKKAHIGAIKKPVQAYITHRHTQPL